MEAETKYHENTSILVPVCQICEKPVLPYTPWARIPCQESDPSLGIRGATVHYKCSKTYLSKGKK